MMRKILLQLTILMLGIMAGFALRSCAMFAEPVTLTSLSPDETIRVTLVERRFSFDRNFELRVEDLATGQARTVFESPDEGRPVGTERIIWSTDGSRFLLLGRHFYVAEQVKPPWKEVAYLLMDVNSGSIRCNAIQQTDFPGFQIEELKAIKWSGWIPN